MKGLGLRAQGLALAALDASPCGVLAQTPAAATAAADLPHRSELRPRGCLSHARRPAGDRSDPGRLRDPRRRRPQKIEQFERVVVRGGIPQDLRREPNSVEEGRQAAQNPRARVFVVFLDINHVSIDGSHRIRQPLIDALDRLIGPDDLVAVMTPEMSAARHHVRAQDDDDRRLPHAPLDLGRARIS